ncbi:MAG TPA: hypothetical protein VGV57_09700 [Thermoleophilaceae bacterium]|nr:hypothetical protein [Thermoleophilaceae bacterium]
MFGHAGIAPRPTTAGWSAASSREALYDEVPRTGARVTRLWQQGRAANGATHLWLGRRRDLGRGEGSSGLRFDAVDHR